MQKALSHTCISDKISLSEAVTAYESCPAAELYSDDQEDKKMSKHKYPKIEMIMAIIAIIVLIAGIGLSVFSVSRPPGWNRIWQP